MYYHIMIESKHDKTDMYELDLTSKEEVIENFVIPYLKGEKFLFSGFMLTSNNIGRFLVKETNQTTSVISKHEQENLAAGLIMVVTRMDIFGYEEYTRDITREIFELSKQKLKDIGQLVKDNVKNEIDRTKVFIVHGHDNSALNEVALFVRQLGLTPIIIREQVNSGKTIIEKIESNSDVGFGIVLYTPCDVGATKNNEDNLQPRARQNVVFEHGYLLGKVGRGNVASLIKKHVEIPNDISGMVYINMDENSRWHVELAKEMKVSGYKVDLNALI